MGWINHRGIERPDLCDLKGELFGFFCDDGSNHRSVYVNRFRFPEIINNKIRFSHSRTIGRHFLASRKFWSQPSSFINPKMFYRLIERFARDLGLSSDKLVASMFSCNN